MSELWPIVTGVTGGIVGFASFVLVLFQVKHLRLSLRQVELTTIKLAEEVKEAQRRIYEPTPEEIEKYDRSLERLVTHVSMAKQDRFRHLAELRHTLESSVDELEEVEREVHTMLGRQLEAQAEAIERFGARLREAARRMAGH